MIGWRVRRNQRYRKPISREFVIAMGPASAAMLALICARWSEVQRVWSAPTNQLYVGATLLCLGTSVVAAPLAIETAHPSALVGAVQIFGVVWASTLVIGTFVPDIWSSLTAGLDESRALVLACLAAATALLCLLALAAYVAVTTMPWWTILAILAVATARATLYDRYGSVVRRLAERLPNPQL